MGKSPSTLLREKERMTYFNAWKASCADDHVLGIVPFGLDLSDDSEELEMDIDLMVEEITSLLDDLETSLGSLLA
jgi:hypothetical protein